VITTRRQVLPGCNAERVHLFRTPEAMRSLCGTVHIKRTRKPEADAITCPACQRKEARA